MRNTAEDVVNAAVSQDTSNLKPIDEGESVSGTSVVTASLLLTPCQNHFLLVAVAAPTNPKIKISTLFVSSEEDGTVPVSEFKRLTLNRDTLIDTTSLMATETILPKPPKPKDFEGSPEVLAFSEYSKSSAFMTREEFVHFCKDKYQLGETSDMILKMTDGEVRFLLAVAEKSAPEYETADDVQHALAGNPAIVAMLSVMAKEVRSEVAKSETTS